ncbi:imm11 family protein [Labrys miyagiensis]|uniref:imm11 family protein n=1 Tax=Labrys miyagiensis TaxID=346912 RepID=UPI0024E075A5|nr:DUF1629 domain-containing protein [Labrys miyagiensis]
MFKAINDNGDQYFPEMPGRVWSLKGGYRLTEMTTPPIHSVYHRAKMAGRTKVLPDIFHVMSEICVNHIVRDIIEFYEPDIHQFFSIKLFRTNAEIFDGEYYLLNVCKLLSSIIFEKSSFVRQPVGHGVEIVTPTYPPRRTSHGDTIRNSHLWRESIYLSDFYISEDIYRSYKKYRLKGVDKHNFVPLEEA